jgi:hypothetical protein
MCSLCQSAAADAGSLNVTFQQHRRIDPVRIAVSENWTKFLSVQIRAMTRKDCDIPAASFFVAAVEIDLLSRASCA